MGTYKAEEMKFETIPAGKYLACLVDNQQETGKFGEQVKLIWEIEKPAKFAGKQKFDWTNTTLSKSKTDATKSSKLWKRAEALYNRPIEIGENIDFDLLTGRRVVLVFSEETKQAISELTGELETTKTSKIAAVLPYEKQEPWPVGETNVGDQKPDPEVDPFDEE